MNYFQYRGATPVLRVVPYASNSAGYATWPSQASASPALGDVSRLITEGLLKPLLDGLREAGGNLYDSLSGLQTPAPARPTHNHACGDPCGCTPQPDCHCQCCISDADLVVYARLGETRVVPIEVENRWRRQRDLSVTLSGFTTRGGKAAPVSGHVLTPGPFKLAACGEQTVVLLIQSAIAPAGADSQDQNLPLPDVDDCLVSYANLELTGCDRRPLRIAVALLPRDCQTLRVDCSCDCGCC